MKAIQAFYTYFGVIVFLRANLIYGFQYSNVIIQRQRFYSGTLAQYIMVKVLILLANHVIIPFP